MSSGKAAFRSRNKLNRPTDFQKVFSSKQRSADKHFLILARKNNLHIARLGLAVPKRHNNNSVKRNRIKRVIREAFRIRQKDFTGFDLMVVVRAPISNINQDQFGSVMYSHWKKINKCRPC